MTLEDISVLFGDPVELSFEQALQREQTGDKDSGFHISEDQDTLEKSTNDHVEKLV